MLNRRFKEVEGGALPATDDVSDVADRARHIRYICYPIRCQWLTSLKPLLSDTEHTRKNPISVCPCLSVSHISLAGIGSIWSQSQRGLERHSLVASAWAGQHAHPGALRCRVQSQVDLFPDVFPAEQID